MLLAAVGLVLLIACANLANLFAARGAARERIRRSCGGRRHPRQNHQEAFTREFFSRALGGAFGFFFAVWIRDGLIALSPEDVSRFQQISFDLPCSGIHLLVASLTTVLFGLWPAWQASHANVQLALKSSAGSGDPPSTKRARDWLVISEIALTLTLLVAAGLVVKSFSRLQSLSLGYEPRALFTARFELPWRKYNNRDKIDTFAKALLDKVRAIPACKMRLSVRTDPYGRLANWLLARREPATATFGYVERRSRSGRRRLFSTLKVPLCAAGFSTSGTQKIRRGSLLSIKRWPKNIFPAKIRSASASELTPATTMRARS